MHHISISSNNLYGILNIGALPGGIYTTTDENSELKQLAKNYFNIPLP